MSLSRDLGTAIADLASQPLPAAVAAHASDAILNVVATAIGGSRHPAVETVVSVGRSQGGRPILPVPGRRESLDLTWAALGTGVAAHVLDFDDTHIDTVTHPGATMLGVVLPLASARGATGERALSAFVLGCEVEIRIASAMWPWHYDAGWHSTGTCGAVGAAVAAGVVAGCGPDQLVRAMAIAASETLGQREAFGTMTKAFHAGKGAWNGILALLLSEKELTASTRPLEAPRGFFNVLSSEHRPERVLDALGTTWRVLEISLKPYPCGVVAHPAIDAAISLHGRIDPEQIEDIEVRCHPLVPELMGGNNPMDELEARFSAAHGVAVGIIDGHAGIPQFAASRVTEPLVKAVRSRVRLRSEPSRSADSAALEVRLRGGEALNVEVEHARGSISRPLTTAELRVKVEGLVEPLRPGLSEDLARCVSELQDAPDLGRLVAALIA
jgi:2-methylcitrate dehydratase PrpD